VKSNGKLSIRLIPKIVKIIQLINLKILLNKEYFLKVLIIIEIIVNLKINPLKYEIKANILENKD